MISGEKPGAGLEATKAAAVRVPGSGPSYLVAVEFSENGIDSSTGVWAMDDIGDADGSVWSVDAVAASATTWPGIDETSSPLGSGAEAVELVTGCLSIA